MIQTSAVCSRSNSLTWISPVRAVDGQWIRLKPSPGAYGRMVVASGVVCWVRTGVERLPSRLTAWRRQRGNRLDPRIDDDGHAVADGRVRLEEAERVAGPDLERVDPEVAAAPQRHVGDPGALASRAERDRPAGQRHGQRGRVVDLQPELREPARAAQRVGRPELVADVRLELVHGVPGLEVGQADARDEVAPAQHEEAEVDEVEEEGRAGAERATTRAVDDDQERQAAEEDHGQPRCCATGAPARPGLLGLDPARAGGPAGASTGTVSRISRTTVPESTSRMDELVLMIRRCASAGPGQRLDVVRDHVVAAEERRARLAGPVEGDAARAARRRGRRRGGSACAFTRRTMYSATLAST